MDFDSCRADMDREAERLRYDGRGILTKSIGRQPRERAKPTPVTDDHDADPFGEKKSGPPCAHCGKPGHHIKQCFSLHPELVPKRKDKTGEKGAEKRSERPEHAKIASNAPPEDYAMAWTVTTQAPTPTPARGSDDHFITYYFGEVTTRSPRQLSLPLLA
jgi:hypothetical protein